MNLSKTELHFFLSQTSDKIKHYHDTHAVLNELKQLSSSEHKQFIAINKDLLMDLNLYFSLTKRARIQIN